MVWTAGFFEKYTKAAEHLVRMKCWSVKYEVLEQKRLLFYVRLLLEELQNA